MYANIPKQDAIEVLRINLQSQNFLEEEKTDIIKIVAVIEW